MRGSSVSSLFVFNPTLKPAWPHPTEEDYTLCKLMYYYPETAPSYEMQSHVGLAEGLGMFVSQFSANPLESIHTEKHTHILYQCEPNLYVCIVLQHNTQGEGFIRQQDLETHPELLQQIAQAYYKNFYLFHGPLRNFAYPQDIPTLKTLLSDYTAAFLYEQSTKEDPFEGFYYCPLDRKVYMFVVFLLTQLSSAYPEIQHVMLTYEGYLVSTTLPQPAALILYNYFSRNKQWKKISSFKREPSPNACQYARSFSYPKKGFLYGKQDQLINTPIVHLEGCEPMKLVTWCQDSLQLVLLLRNAEINIGILDALSALLESTSEDLISAIMPQHQRASLQEDNFRFIYFNMMNLAIKQSTRLTTIDDNLYRLITTLSAQMKESTNKTDALVKTLIRTHTAWVLALKTLESREIYVILPPSTAPANRVEEEITRFVSHYFHNIFTGI